MSKHVELILCALGIVMAFIEFLFANFPFELRLFLAIIVLFVFLLACYIYSSIKCRKLDKENEKLKKENISLENNNNELTKQITVLTKKLSLYENSSNSTRDKENEIIVI